MITYNYIHFSPFPLSMSSFFYFSLTLIFQISSQDLSMLVSSFIYGLIDKNYFEIINLISALMIISLIVLLIISLMNLIFLSFLFLQLFILFNFYKY